jgi:integrase/recombinase XerC
MAQLTKTKFLTNPEYDAVKKLCLKNIDDRRACFILVCLYTGARRIEVLGLKQDDLVEDSILIHGAKGSLDREIPIPAAIFSRLKELPDKLFDVHRDTANSWWELYRPNRKRGLHSLRHTMALRLYKQTKDIRLVKYLLGHKSIHNTMVYAEYAYSQDELRKVLNVEDSEYTRVS